MSDWYHFEATYDGSGPFGGNVKVDEGQDPEDAVLEKLEADLSEAPTSGDVGLVEISYIEEGYV